ncbi:hypothetical protein GYMLUDRAFT_1005657 [Collybiopsis luxurians FD-317 M1]|uniref:L-tryptophan decarboxylase PsiD-like domain-containing protein n=1 Tax=Collybiopsis luxurians FD-317 M1 TaxID=944289 RepID=A0A0D0CSV1_9AGAR|nr:hypothetical protein GYMLUDRAFT_1005657 [Collybiopsis luxurians FD-317 M1]
MAITAYNGWLPANPAVYQRIVQAELAVARGPLSTNAPHRLAVQNLKDVIVKDPEMNYLIGQIFLQASARNPNQPDQPDQPPQSFDELLYALDSIIVSPPRFHVIQDEDGNDVSVPIGVPIYVLFDLLSNTAAAYDLFRKPAFNTAMRNLLNTWGEYLTTKDSSSTLTEKEDGWFSERSLQMLEANAGVFNLTYDVPEPEAPNRGYTSWDHFFTRPIQKAARPVEGDPSDPSNDRWIIINACESTAYRIQENVQEHDRFWIKGQFYSLYDMLGGDTQTVQSLVGGTIYQAFLSPQDYHRWHSPVDGTITKVENLQGTYYAVLPDGGAPENDPDLQPHDLRGALIRSQAWITMHAARAIIHIENPDLGTVIFIGVGMAEVSTCEVTVAVGREVTKGDELGMFRFGGSTHTLIFGPKVKVEFEPDVEINKHRWVNKRLAIAAPIPL